MYTSQTYFTYRADENAMAPGLWGTMRPDHRVRVICSGRLLNKGVCKAPTNKPQFYGRDLISL